MEPFTWSGWTGGGSRPTPLNGWIAKAAPAPATGRLTRWLGVHGGKAPWRVQGRALALLPSPDRPGESTAPGACCASSCRVHVAYGTDTSHRTILVPLVQPGGLGSCTLSKTPKPPCQGGFRVFRDSTSTPRQSGLPTPGGSTCRQTASISTSSPARPRRARIAVMRAPRSHRNRSRQRPSRQCRERGDAPCPHRPRLYRPHPCRPQPYRPAPGRRDPGVTSQSARHRTIPIRLRWQPRRPNCGRCPR